MKVYNSLEDLTEKTDPIALAIGNYDGVHLGHQFILSKLCGLVHPKGGKTALITFSNHPAEILRPSSPTKRLLTLEHKLKLLEQYGSDIVILLPFTLSLSQLTAEQFLELVQLSLPFSHLILGHDATLGKDRQGDRQSIQTFAALKGFKVEYVEQLTLEGMRVSSSKIREYLQLGNLDMVEKLLGRKYTIYGKRSVGMGLGKQLGYPTINLDVENLCLPPYGVYAATLYYENVKFKAIANLGVAPTVRSDSKPILEIHILDTFAKIPASAYIEIGLTNYLRPEIQFDNLEQLKAQIAQDIINTKSLL